MFLVIGSDNSSNSKRLVEVAKKAGCAKSQLINFKKEFPIKEIVECNTIGLTSGASAPEKLVQDFISEIKKLLKEKEEKAKQAEAKKQSQASAQNASKRGAMPKGF